MQNARYATFQLFFLTLYTALQERFIEYLRSILDFLISIDTNIWIYLRFTIPHDFSTNLTSQTILFLLRQSGLL